MAEITKTAVRKIPTHKKEFHDDVDEALNSKHCIIGYINDEDEVMYIRKGVDLHPWDTMRILNELKDTFMVAMISDEILMTMEDDE